jgi:uncharacterized membrane protein
MIYTIIFCFGLFAIMLSMFVAHTFDYENIILGVQGRYLLPFLPIVALILRNNVVTSNKNLHNTLLFGILALNLAYLVRIVAYATIV